MGIYLLTDEDKSILNLLKDEKDKKQFIVEFIEKRGYTKDEVFEFLAEASFDKLSYDKSLYYYARIKKKSEKVLFNKGLIYIYSGNYDKGLALMEEAYKVKHNFDILLYKQKSEYIIGRIDTIQIFEKMVKQILEEPLNDRRLAFLVWYYDQTNEIENSMTSYLQIYDTKIKKDYLPIFLKQAIAMDEEVLLSKYICDIIEGDKEYFYYQLASAYYRAGKYRPAQEVILRAIHWEGIRKEPFLLLSAKCAFLEKNIMRALECMNQIKEEQLYEAEKEAYTYNMSVLAEYASEYRKQDVYSQKLLALWHKKYRRIFLEIMDIEMKGTKNEDIKEDS